MSVSAIICRGYNGGVNNIPVRGYLGNIPSVSTQSGIRRLAVSHLQGEHPQITYERGRRRRNEEEELITLLVKMMDDIFDD